MDPQDLTYDICRCYITDLPNGTLPDDILKKLSGWIRSRSIDHLATCTTLSGPALSTLDQYSTLMQIEAFFKKNKSFSDDQRCRSAALLSFERGERICRIANRRLDYYYLQQDRLDPDLKEQVSRMERILDSILGEYGTFLEKLPRLVRVTSGATATKSRRKSLPHLRVSKMPYAAPNAAPYLQALSRYFGYGRIRIRETLANRLEFVPKNWKTYRSIACEPEGNVFLQLAFDTYVKGRLRRVGIDLSDQSKNQQLAKEGSLDGRLATIDLSMASDTLAFNAVAWLFPKSWFDYLNAVRSPRSRGEASVQYAKFSSMGNGCTFALETLVFYAACRALGSKECSVYGDDIIIESSLVVPLVRLLRFFGFSVNTDKSHFTGPFRESCGANWFQGTDITPVYLRDIDRRKAMMCHLVNTLAGIARPGGTLVDLLLKITFQNGLPFVPFNENTTSGVWVNSPTSRRLKLIRSKNWITKFRSYVPVATRGRTSDSRSLFLWYLDTLEKGRPLYVPRGIVPLEKWYLKEYRNSSEPYSFVCRTRYTSSSHRFRRKWVHWHSPVVGAPDHLDWWSEALVPPL